MQCHLRESGINGLVLDPPPQWILDILNRTVKIMLELIPEHGSNWG
jgi:hypothetical protein